MKLLRALLSVAAFGAVSATAMAAQDGDLCDLDPTVQPDVDVQGDLIYVRSAFLVRCQSGSELRGNSAVIDRITREIDITGNVQYEDANRRLTSQQATYTTSTGRLYATGSVVFSDKTRQSTLRGPELEYFRPMGDRTLARIAAGQRPHLTVVPESGANGEPLEIDADRVDGVGQDRFTAVGNVVIRRSDLDAVASQVDYDAAVGTLQLRRNARITRTVGDPVTLSGDAVDARLAGGVVDQVVSRGNAKVVGERFDLAGSTIDAAIPGGQIRQVTSRGDAALTAEELRVDGPEILLFFEADSLQRMVAPRGGEGQRPVATATTFRITADSLDALLPGQQLDRVIAVGEAYGEAFDTLPDGSPAVTLGAPPGAVDRDWISGDTLTGFFAPKPIAAALPAPADSTAPREKEEVELRRLVARGGARSLYRVADDGAGTAGASSGPPELNYVSGSIIELAFEAGELDLARIEGLERGLYLEPVASGQPPPASAPPTPAGRR